MSKQRDKLVFRFEGKSGIEHSIEIDDPEVLDALDSLRRRRGGTERLLAYQCSDAGATWTPRP